MTKKRRPTLAELRASIRSGHTFSRTQIVNALDDMHDRLRDEVRQALADAVNTRGGFVMFKGEDGLVLRHTDAQDAARNVFDRRKRRKKK